MSSVSCLVILQFLSLIPICDVIILLQNQWVFCIFIFNRAVCLLCVIADATTQRDLDAIDQT